MRSVHVLADLYGPRITGSETLEAAGRWTAGQLSEWGLKNVHLEPWNFGHVGWENDRVTAHALRPFRDTLTVESVAWTPSTDGPVRANAIQVPLPNLPTSKQLAAHLDGVRDAVRGKIVLLGAPQQLFVTFSVAAPRRDDASILLQMTGGPAPAVAAVATRGPDEPLIPQAIEEAIDRFLAESGALARVIDSGRDHGQIRAAENRTRDLTKAVPSVVMRNEDYGRIWRLLSDGRDVELEIDVSNRIHPEGTTAYNVIAELPGRDNPDEVIMIGAHLDSWHTATGATDNAVGVAVMLEAMRILAQSGVAPRRTIRLALWSGEEQGLLGSKAYVRQHFGTAESPTPAYHKFGGYFNMDAGTGAIRGMTTFGPLGVAMALREVTFYLKDLGVVGATSSLNRLLGSSDYTAFNAEGLPGINLIQDPIQYQSHTWHSNLDMYERIIEEDAKRAAIIVACAAYHLSIRDELLPRFSADDMPRRPRGQP